MKVLVACEFSGVVRDVFRAKGHDAVSCDLLPSERGLPHYTGNVLDILCRGNLSSWDMLIAHPPCTYLANSGVTWLYNKDGSRNEQRWQDMKDAAAFFKKLLYAPIQRIVIENPIQHKYAREEIGVSWGQMIHPWQFGHMEQKPTCLWLKNVPALKGTNNVYDVMKKLPANKRQRIHYMPPSETKQKDRSVTCQWLVFIHPIFALEPITSRYAHQKIDNHLTQIRNITDTFKPSSYRLIYKNQCLGF